MNQTNINKIIEQKKVIAVLLCVLFIFGIVIHKNIEKKNKIAQSGAYAVSVGLQRVQHGVTKLTSNNANYLKNSKEYSKAFNEGKILVIYPYPDANSPFSKVFSQEFDKAINDPKYTSIYEFLTFPENPNNQFFKNCHSICFVNPQKQELFYIVRTGNDAGKQLTFILDGLMKW